ncbi:MAG: hypothetical protein COV45_01500 [Deltaproteobacteria bacterium CG11_big_fil_rev_8_21_14_0_20_47_16]|nr:MAG: hypothetical protein COV45_01500 [Deltaproteobacteria bacterium CG11_big_fil_rev_8_21_14_0_20_47_16]
MRYYLLCLIAGLAAFYNKIAFAAAELPTTQDPPYVVMFLIDGARGDLIHTLADEGKLPNIKALFMDQGLDVVQATTVFPTTSTNAYQSFMTGLYPGHAGIPYLARYSRSDQESIEYLSLKGIKILNADLLNWYQLNDPTHPYDIAQGSLFNHLSDLKTASVYSTFRRDATIQKPGLPLRAAWATFILGNYEDMDILAYKALKKLYEKPISQIPHLSLTALLAVDEIAHKEGAFAQRTIKQFETVDRIIGDFWELLQKRGLADKTYLVLVGDHGNHDIKDRSFLRERLIKRGIAIRSRQMHPPYKLSINARGVSSAIISVAGKDGWKSRPTLDDLHHVPTVRKKGEVDLIEYLRSQPETDLLLVRDGNSKVRVYNADSESEVVRVWSGGRFWYSYHLLKGKDPIHYMEDPKLAPLITKNIPLTSQQWLPLTSDKTYSDAIVQIGQIFTDGRIGDIVIVAKRDWVFRHEKANTHGTLLQDDMHIPIMMHGPGIKPQKINYARSVDVMPTILSFYNRSTPYRDGQNLLAPDPLPTAKEASLARLEIQYATEATDPPHDFNLKPQIIKEKARIQKLQTIVSRCQNTKVDYRLTKPDRPKKMRESTCEVVDLALKTAYEDLQRLEQLEPVKITHATHHPIQHAELDRPKQ